MTATHEPGERATAAAEKATGSARRPKGVKLSVYKHLLEVNTGFDQVVRGLAALRRNDIFLTKELDRFSALAKEARAATNSYLIAEMAEVETHEAGRRFGKRRDRELREE
jgi:hypothetical protein